MARSKPRRRKPWRFTPLRVFLKLHSAHATFGAGLALTEMPKERRHSAVRDELAANTFRDLHRRDYRGREAGGAVVIADDGYEPNRD